MMQIWFFWVAVSGITLGVALLLIQALRRGGAESDDGAALKVYRDQLAEVDRDLARGVIAAPEAERVKTEVSRRLLDADRAQKATATPAQGSALWPAAVIIASLLAAALVAYNRLGAPGYPDLPLAARLALADEAARTRPSQAEDEASAPKSAPVQADAQTLATLDQLRAAVKDRPDDQQGLAFLVKYESQLGNFIAARTAFEHLVALKGDQATAQDHAELAQTMIFAAGGRVSPEAEQHLIKALTLDPRHPLARYFSGLMFAENDRPDRAFALWEPLLREGPADAPWIAPIRGMLQDTADAAGIKYQLPAAAKGPSAADVAAAGEMTPEQRQDMVKTMVAGLESRLMADGGPVEDWIKLINALMVLGEADRAHAALSQATAAYAGDGAAILKLSEAASQSGLVK